MDVEFSFSRRMLLILALALMALLAACFGLGMLAAASVKPAHAPATAAKLQAPSASSAPVR